MVRTSEELSEVEDAPLSCGVGLGASETGRGMSVCELQSSDANPCG
jgi:hypothetical protein